MKLRTKYILFVVILHLTAVLLSYFIFRENKLLFIVSEVFIIISIIISWRLFKELIDPLKLLMQGTEAIKDRDFNVKFLPTGKYEMDELIKVYNRMIDELRIERTKQEQQHLFLEKLIHTSPTGIIILDYDDKIQRVNPRAAQLLNIAEKELLSKPVHEISHPVIHQIKQMQSGTSKTLSLNGIATYKLQKSHFIDRGFPRHFIMIEELTAEILAAEKKAYEKVIRVMAHEVNNSIGAVNSILQSALTTKSIWQEAGNELLKSALEVAVDRNYNLNTFMRNFADLVRLPEPQKKRIDLHQLIYSTTHLMKMKAGEKRIQFQYQFDDASFYISADGQLMEQVLINIVKNAMEAIDTNGIITFNLNHEAQELVIIDTGRGITPGESAQLFNPFFSTKKDGQGIGLTLIKEILLNHGFSFSLRTVQDNRTEFVIRF